MKKTATKGNRDVAFALFGATGDLAVKKIFPALEGLMAEGALGKDPAIVATGRRDWGSAEFRSFLAAASPKLSKAFLAKVSYVVIDIEKGTGYGSLAPLMGKRAGVFYSSLAPTLHGRAIEGLREAGLIGPASKVLIEKPFGTDERSACELDRFLSSFLDESQIFRVDHYLGKDAVMAAMDLQEAAQGWSKLLASESVREIKVLILEEKGIDGRGASYDGVGAFRDVGQNHILEMLAVVAAEPARKGAVDWQKARAAALKRLAPPAKTCDLSRRAQYDGYLAEKGVRPGSETETAFEVVTNFSSGKLKGVPLVLEAGKMMPSSEASIEISFKEISGLPRAMRFSVQPEQSISIENRDGTAEAYDIPRRRDAYGNVILAALRGDRRIFVGKAEVEALWAYADRVVACWGKVPLEKYGKERPFLIQ